MTRHRARDTREGGPKAQEDCGNWGVQRAFVGEEAGAQRRLQAGCFEGRSGRRRKSRAWLLRTEARNL